MLLISYLLYYGLPLASGAMLPFIFEDGHRQQLRGMILIGSPLAFLCGIVLAYYGSRTYLEPSLFEGHFPSTFTFAVACLIVGVLITGGYLERHHAKIPDATNRDAI